MSSIRQRKFKEKSQGVLKIKDAPSIIPKAFDGKTRIFFTTLFSLFSLMTLFWILESHPKYVPAVISSSLNEFLDFFGLSTSVYAVVIDAGSTGSRVLAFSFHRNYFSGSLFLKDETWSQIEPGLSSHSHDPKGGASSIASLLEIAKKSIPTHKWSTTPITLKATAGLRLLPTHQSDSILKEVKDVLLDSEFQVKDSQDLIEIMNPMEEGLFAWFTLNFLLESLYELQNSYVALDLGGGSTQITFYPLNKVYDLEKRKHFLHNVTVYSQSIHVYSHSYLGLGLMSARQSIFLHGAQNSKNLHLTSPCVLSSLSWTFVDKDYVVTPTNNASYENCANVVRQVIRKENIHVPDEIQTREIASFSYFFDRALESQLIFGSQGRILIEDYIREAKRVCSLKSGAFECVDLVFISSLLTEGYGLNPQKEIHLFSKINGHTTSWALGAAFKILEKEKN